MSVIVVENKIRLKGAIAISEMLKVNNTLTQLLIGNLLIKRVGSSYLEDTDVVHIGEALKVNRGLKLLELSMAFIVTIDWNKAKVSGMKAIAKALEVNKSLISLSLCKHQGND